jgi:AcrR family transcriptional regulator
MIADAIGVTKAAVYHQFQSKEAILLAVSEVELRGLAAALDAAEAEGSSVQAREVLLEKVIDVAIERRGAVGTLQSDPVMIRFQKQQEPFQRLMARLFSVLLGGDTGAGARVQAAMLMAAIGGTVAHPYVADLDENTLRSELSLLTRRLVRASD